MRASALIALISLGCASTAEIPETRTGVQPVIIDRGNGATTTITLNQREDAYSAEFKTDVPTLWTQLQRVFNNLELPISAIDSAQHLLSSGPGKLRRIGKQPIALYLECSGTAYGNAASAGDVYVTVHTQLLPRTDGSELRVVVQGNSVSENGMTRGNCRSTGKLEAQIAELLK